MRLEIKDLKQPISKVNDARNGARCSTGAAEEVEALKQAAAKKLRLDIGQIKNIKILKKSVDARKKDQISFIYTLVIDIPDKERYRSRINNKDITAYEAIETEPVRFGDQNLNNRPIIIGSGPAGLFAGLILAENGYKPLILERGRDVDTRTENIQHFFCGGAFLENSNIQFGEGGAGTFSDGKLTTRIKDRRCDIVLDRLISFGAPSEIAYINKPHIGTDILKVVIRNLRNRIIALGGEVRFQSQVTDIIVKQGVAEGVVINQEEILTSNVVIAALGHSARDTYKMLYDRGVQMIAKAFSIGVRIEHPQMLIDRAQYGSFAGHPALGAADYTLAFRSNTTGRSAYSFCMCPGGTVVAATSEEGMVVTNGMSEFKRDKENANSALVVSVSPEDFEHKHPLAGIDFQRTWERKAFEAGGGKYHGPIQLVKDFVLGQKTTALGRIKPSYLPGTRGSDLNACLPDYVTLTLREALQDFDRKIKGFAEGDAVMTGVETRTSAPLRMVRKENMESESIGCFYPIGEGAGYAGGIVSAAVDGIKCAEKIMVQFKPV